MRGVLYEKGMVIAIICLFLGAGIIPSLTTVIAIKFDGNWNSTEVVSTEGSGASWLPSIAVENDGTVHVVWYDNTNYAGSGSDNDIFYKYKPYGDSWSTTEVISTESSECSYSPSLAVYEGTVHVVWDDFTNFGGSGSDRDIFYKYKPYGGSWSTTEVVSTESTAYSYCPIIDIDSNGKIHIAWEDQTNYNGCGNDHDIFYKYKSSGGSWSITEVASTESTSPSYRVSIDIDNNDAVHLVWHDDTDYSGSGSDRDIFYKYKPYGGSWSTTEVVSTESTGTSNEPSMGVASNGNVHVTWFDNSNYAGSGSDVDIFYKYKSSDGSWSTTEVVSTEMTESSWDPSLDIGLDEIVHITWYDNTIFGGSGSDRDIFYKYKPYGGSWSTVELVSAESTLDSKHPSLVTDFDGNVHVVWDDHTNYNGCGSDLDIFYKYKEGGGNQPPLEPNIITGSYDVLDINEVGLYGVWSIDYEGDEIYYWVDWDDGTNTGWIGPYHSQHTVHLQHSWSERGIYTVKAKAKDEHGLESTWSGTLNWDNIGFILVDYNSMPYFIHITDPHVFVNPLPPFVTVWSGGKIGDVFYPSVPESFAALDPPPEFVVCTGDLVEWGCGLGGSLNYNELKSPLYKSGNYFYCDPQHKIPIYFCPGNHDAKFGSNFNNYYDNIYNGDYFHVIEDDMIAIFSLNSGMDTCKTGDNCLKLPEGDGLYSDEVTQLIRDLDALDGSMGGYDESPYIKVILMHHPYETLYVNEKDGTFWDMKYDFIKLCNDYNVDLVLSGHLHNDQKFTIGDSTTQVITNDFKNDLGYRIIDYFGSVIPMISERNTATGRTQNIDKVSFSVGGVKAFASTISGEVIGKTVLHIYDDKGNHDGPGITGEIEREIYPFSYTIWTWPPDYDYGDTAYTTFSVIKETEDFPFASENYTFKITGLADGTMNFTLRTFLKEGIWNEAKYSNITMYNGSIATIYSNASLYINESTPDYIMKITDPNGDFREISPSVWDGNLSPIIYVSPSGPSLGKPLTEYSFSINASDPDDDQVYYLFDWGDGTDSGWFGSYDSGEIVTASHAWSKDDTYHIKVKAKDIWNHVSEWSPTLSVTIGDDPPLVQLIYPTGGETLKDTIDIEWSAYDNNGGDNVQILIYLIDSSNDVTRLTPEYIENIGSFSWDTTTVPDGDYKLQVTAKQGDKFGYDSSDYFTVKNHDEPPENHAPNKPSRPTGETSGKTGEEYSYTTMTNDQDGDQIWFKWNWGDGNQSEWIGPYSTGDTCEASYTWHEKDDYEIKVKAKDVHGEESPWSDPLPITMPKNKAINPFILFLERLMERFPILEQILQPIYNTLINL